MHRYRILKAVGDGTYGSVLKAQTEKGDVVAIKEAINASSERGIQSFDVALHGLVKQNRVTLDEALMHADSRANLETKINFG